MERSKVRPHPQIRPHQHLNPQKPATNLPVILPGKDIRENTATAHSPDRKKHRRNIPETIWVRGGKVVHGRSHDGLNFYPTVAERELLRRKHGTKTFDPRERHRCGRQLRRPPTPHGHPGTLPRLPTPHTDDRKLQHRPIDLHGLRRKRGNTCAPLVRTTARVATVTSPLRHLRRRTKQRRTTALNRHETSYVDDDLMIQAATSQNGASLKRNADIDEWRASVSSSAVAR